jgi:hypothetical protein
MDYEVRSRAEIPDFDLLSWLPAFALATIFQPGKGRRV